MKIVKKIFGYLIIALVLGYIVFNYYQDHKRDQAREAAALKKEQEIVAVLKGKTKQTNALIDWPVTLLRGDSLKMRTVLTIELEKLWQGKRPILFFGSINDIATLDQLNYKVVIDRNSFATIATGIIGTELLLELKCQRANIDLLIKNNPDIVKDIGLPEGIAVIAKINKIRSETRQEKEGGSTAVRIGVGECIDIVYTGSVGLKDLN